jgi:hypothetical protein
VEESQEYVSQFYRGIKGRNNLYGLKLELWGAFRSFSSECPIYGTKNKGIDPKMGRFLIFGLALKLPINFRR